MMIKQLFKTNLIKSHALNSEYFITDLTVLNLDNMRLFSLE